MAPLSAALANGDDTLSITADCYSTAGTDAAITAALLAYYTSSQVDTLLQGQRRPAPSQPRCWPTTPPHKWTPCWETTARARRRTRRRRRPSGALLAYRTGPDQDVFTTNQITSVLVAYRSAADQDTATASSIAAAQLLHHRASRRPPCQQARSHGGSLGAANSRALSGRRRGRRGGGRHRRAALSNWTVRPSSGCSVVLGKCGRLHPDPGGEPVEHCAHLQLDPGPRAPLTPAATGSARPPTSWRTCPRPTTSTTQCTVASSATRAPTARPRCTSQCLQTEWQSCTLGVDVYGLQILDATRGRQHGGGGHGGLGPAAEARLPRRRGRRRHAGHPGQGAAGAHAHHIRKFSGATGRALWPWQLCGGRLPAGTP